MREVTEYVDRQSRQGVVVLGGILLIFVGLIDYLTENLPFEPFYLLPISIIAWFGSCRAGITVALTATAIWYFVNDTTIHFHTTLAGVAWHMAVECVLFISFAVLVSSLRSALAYRQMMARSDALTGMFNGKYFAELALGEINRSSRYAHSFTFACIEFPLGGSENPYAGMGPPTALISSVANVMHTTLRGTDIAARLNDNMFAVLLPETGHDAARIVIQKLHEYISELIRGKGWQVTFGIGAATFLSPPVDVDEMLRVAGKLVHAACRQGSNQVRHEVVK